MYFKKFGDPYGLFLIAQKTDGENELWERVGTMAVVPISRNIRSKEEFENVLHEMHLSQWSSSIYLG